MDKEEWEVVEDVPKQVVMNGIHLAPFPAVPSSFKNSPEGWMQKRSERDFMPTWANRFFSLSTNQEITYFVDQYQVITSFLFVSQCAFSYAGTERFNKRLVTEANAMGAEEEFSRRD